MVFVKTFKGYEDRMQELDTAVNTWLAKHDVDVRGLETALAHEPGGRARMGDLIYTVMYKADAPIEDEEE